MRTANHIYTYVLIVVDFQHSSLQSYRPGQRWPVSQKIVYVRAVAGGGQINYGRRFLYKQHLRQRHKSPVEKLYRELVRQVSLILIAMQKSLRDNAVLASAKQKTQKTQKRLTKTFVYKVFHVSFYSMHVISRVLLKTGNIHQIRLNGITYRSIKQVFPANKTFLQDDVKKKKKRKK